MIQYDRFRHPDSFARRAGMEEAVRRTSAASRLSSRSKSFATAMRRATLILRRLRTSVFSSRVVHPASRTLWHSTTMQPHAPFGEFVPFTFDADAHPPTFPASEVILSGKLDSEREEIKAARHALELHHDGKLEDARKAWDDLLASEVSTLDPTRLALGSAVTREAWETTKRVHYSRAAGREGCAIRCPSARVGVARHPGGQTRTARVCDPVLSGSHRPYRYTAGIHRVRLSYGHRKTGAEASTREISASHQRI